MPEAPVTPRAAPAHVETPRVTTVKVAEPLHPPEIPKPKLAPLPPPRPVLPLPASAASEPAFVVDEQAHKVIHMKPPIVIRDLAQRVGIKPHLLLMELMEMNVFANLNESVEEPVARAVCERHGFLF